MRGEKGAHNKSLRGTLANSFKSDKPIIPSTSITSYSFTSNELIIRERNSTGAFLETFRRTTSPVLRLFKATSNPLTKSSASSSTSMSLSLRTLNVQCPFNLKPGKRFFIFINSKLSNSRYL